MERATFLTRVMVDHYKSIAHCDVPLGTLSYLIGPNGSGKSSFLDALRFIADSLNISLDFAIRRRGGLEEIVQRCPTTPHRFRVSLELALPARHIGKFEAEIGFKDGRAEVLEEYCEVKPPDVSKAPKYYRLTADDFDSNFSWSPRVRRDRLCLVNAGGTSELRAVFDHLSSMRFYNIAPSALARLGVPSTESFLTEDGANITEVLDRLGQGADAPRSRIEEYLRIILPTLEKIEIENAGPGRMLRFWQKLAGYNHSEGFWPSTMSAGTLRALGILTALLQANVSSGPRPSLVAIEEPEAQVNPAVLAVLRDAMLEASYCTQVLVTTHSSDLLDDKEISTESLLAVVAEEGVTRIGPLDAGGQDLIRQHLYTPGELLRIGQVFPADTQSQLGAGAATPSTDKVTP